MHLEYILQLCSPVNTEPRGEIRDRQNVRLHRICTVTDVSVHCTLCVLIQRKKNKPASGVNDKASAAYNARHIYPRDLREKGGFYLTSKVLWPARKGVCLHTLDVNKGRFPPHSKGNLV